METLPDRPCRPGGILLVGINPAPISVAAGHYYQGRHGQWLWRRLGRLGLLLNFEQGREDDAFVAAGNGLTDLVKRPTSSAAALYPAELKDGIAHLRSKIQEWKPSLVLFAYKPPAELLLGNTVRAGRCSDWSDAATFLLSGPYASAAESERIDRELLALIKSFAAGNHTDEPSQSIAAPLVVVHKPTAANGDRTQRITAVDLRHRRIRIPRRSKQLLPASKTELRVNLRGNEFMARYDPRIGPDKERSGMLTFRTDIAALVPANTVLRIYRNVDGQIVFL